MITRVVDDAAPRRRPEKGVDSTGGLRTPLEELRGEGVLPVTDTDIGELIMTITDELPRNEDVARVRAQLASGGWPLADPHSASEFPDGL